VSEPAKPQRVFVGLGSNLGDRWMELKRAVDALPDVVRVSPVYETEPLGGPEHQHPYLNCVVELRTALSARDLLEVGRALEARAGRVKKGKDEPRPLDVDVLLVSDSTFDEPGLKVPHPRMWERRFVLQPLSDLAPEIVGHNWETTARGAVQKLTEKVCSPDEFPALALTMSSAQIS
jgi:2-amino-4-hydroxy-6-hydroxymethyldihydropteridine diphosphokinase